MDWSSTIKGFKAYLRLERSLSANSIEAISIDHIKNEFGLDEIDIVKIDIEGSEEQVFLNDPDWLQKVKLIFCEIHEMMKPGLTNKIKTVLMPTFDCCIHGEYHVFKNKKSAHSVLEK